MSDRTRIEWADASWNPIRAAQPEGSQPHHHPGWHCEIVSPGCEHCYAAATNRRLGTGLAYLRRERARVAVRLDDKTLCQPPRWSRPRRIFVCSMSDLFGEWVSDETIDRVFAVMALCPQHTFQVLTKRAERMRDYLTGHAAGGRGIWEAGRQIVLPKDRDKPQVGWPLPNVWLGVSVEDQRRADERIPLLFNTPSAIHWISLEPLLGWIDLAPWLFSRNIYRGDDTSGFFDYTDTLDWVVVGGESGRGARPMHPEWACSLRDQCAAAGVPFFFKQWGGAHRMALVGKHAAGRLLDGREHNESPPAR